MAIEDAMPVRGVEAGTADMGKLLQMRETARTVSDYVGTTLSHLLFVADTFVNNAQLRPCHQYHPGIFRKPLQASLLSAQEAFQRAGAI